VASDGSTYDRVPSRKGNDGKRDDAANYEQGDLLINESMGLKAVRMSAHANAV
jgi:hypothetical protein